METHQKKQHTARNILLAAGGLVLLACSIFLLVDYVHYARNKSPYKTFIKPRLELALLRITNLTHTRTDLMAHVLMHNPLPFNLRADSLQYKIFINGAEVIKSTYAKSINICRWDSTLFTLPAVTYTDKLVSVLTAAENRGDDSADYEIQAGMGTNIVVHKHFNFDIKTRQPLIFIPRVKLDEIAYDSLSIDGVTLYLETTVINKNAFPLNFKNLTFRVAIADNNWVEGHKYGIVEIPDSSVVHLKLPLRISFKEMGRSIGPLIRLGKEAPFKFELTLGLVSDDNATKNSLIILKDVGAIHKIIKLAKDENARAKAEDERLKETTPALYQSKKQQAKENKPKIEKVQHSN
ncbi:MAG TPA: LEA type 2 family protein [Chitinophagales bacterium]|nr:LEA type 2 family protein [Chitinophagales bacterium]